MTNYLRVEYSVDESEDSLVPILEEQWNLHMEYRNTFWFQKKKRLNIECRRSLLESYLTRVVNDRLVELMFDSLEYRGYCISNGGAKKQLILSVATGE